MLMGECEGYSAARLGNSFDAANDIFVKTFPDGFPWEVIEVYSGPPTVAFKWRHWGKYSGQYTDSEDRVHEGTGERVEIFGLCVARVSASLVIEGLDVYYDPQEVIAPLVAGAPAPPPWGAYASLQPRMPLSPRGSPRKAAGKPMCPLGFDGPPGSRPAFTL